ncbi:hypothetical protein IL992_33675 [Microbispora sp. NEAU-D428]|nr:hypothetical protein [Microbispora sitophila]
MVEQTAAAGHSLERLLPPPAAKPLHTRDYRGQETPPFMPLTAEAALELATDYDLAAAEVRTLLVERAGTRLTGCLVLLAPRRYETGLQAGKPPRLNLWLEDVTDVRFDSDERMEVALYLAAVASDRGGGAHPWRCHSEKVVALPDQRQRCLQVSWATTLAEERQDSDSGVPIEDISRLVGHRNTVVTETGYRKQIRPVLMQGAEKMDSLFEV